MSLVVYNTLSREKELFVPLDPSHVRLYVCGPTVYDYVHIGNARPVVIFDVLYRLLKRRYPRVTYVRNITDIDDKIMVRAAENRESIDTLTERTAAAYQSDMSRLEALSPDVEPRATKYVSEMIALIERLVARGHAYAAEGHVLFDVPSMADYGRLSRRSHDELIAGARVEVAPYKKDPADFVLWKPSTDAQAGWPSPWGRGRPGWHIECSAMSAAHLGETFDIHAGGLDLIFPHHENEIAQSRSAFGHAIMAKYWMHNGFLNISGEKMSKSLGNFFTVHELLDQYPGEVIRLLLLSAQYRQPLDFTHEGLAQAKGTLDRWYGLLRGKALEEKSIRAEVEDALSDDLNTPLAISALHQLRDPSELKAGASALGLLRQDPEVWFRWTPAAAADGPSDAEIDAAIVARQAARKAKDFKESDRIRDDLKARGVILEDGPKGTTWKRG
ncbi:MAG: cysteine--tRNA ligase [Reyranella sp.]|uniref:cysteine--tRNA ligase n=1 Tax=Reyranella sp. TaxID=1929291 RepID=UPI00120C3DF5|nr:cysteine--tRNA ligase [Reyranella sp.]TAJ90936.1 MAG: cysteine--tRNA ligase [Reyranella sp.]TBR28998.1 MAG: cysteine--tRNA ligase [Reyranella sp.]